MVILLITLAVLAVAFVVIKNLFAANEERNRRRARAALSNYLGDVRDGDWHRAFQQLDDDLCPAGEAEYVEFLRTNPSLTSFEIQEPMATIRGIEGTFIPFPVVINGGSETYEMWVGLETDRLAITDGPGCTYIRERL